MKSLITILTCCLTYTFSVGQNITLSFENAQIINEVDDDFYQVDVFMQSDTDFILGPGQFFIDYNEAAFGTEISTNGNLSFEQPDGSILASSSFTVGNYNNFNTNDSGTTRASFNWLQFWSSGTIATDNVGMTPTFLGRIRIQFTDSAVTPDICFNTEDPRDDQIFTACGPFTPAPAGSDCAGEIGDQLFDYTPDCSGALLSTCTGGTTTYTIAGGWDNGVPDETMIAMIAEDYNTATMGLGDINACELTVNAMATLTIADGNFVNIQNSITIDGTLTVDHQGSVVQVEENAITINNGSISVSKTTPTLDDRNFVAMSSPVTAEARDRVYGNSRAVFSIIPSNFVPFDIDLITFPEFDGAENFLDDDNDYLLPVTGNTILPDAGIGQLVFPQPEPNVGDGAYTITYTQNPSNPGTLNSGTITVPINYNGPATINNYNLLGNPYASAIDVQEFITTNDAINEVYYWDHLTNPTSDLPGFGTSNFSMNDISMRNAMMGVAAVNGGAGTEPGQFMASGQGFGIKADQAEMMANTPVVFTNRIRVTGNNDGFRSSDVENNVDKLWLNLTTTGYEEAQSQTGIGFTPDATEGFDKGYDSKRLGTFLSLFTNLDGEYLAIQGREAFDTSIELTLGFSTTIETEESYTISIDHLEGINIENTPVYLIDHLNNTIINLKENNYSFTASKGIQSERFTVIFQERDVLDTDEVRFRESVTLYPNPATNQVTLGYVGEAQLQKFTIIDMNGKVIRSMSLENFQSSQVINTSTLAKGMYFINIQSTRDITIQKLIIR